MKLINEIGEIMFRGSIITCFLLLLLFITNVYAITDGGPAQEIYTKTTPQTYLAQKNELLIIYPQKYPNVTFMILVKDFEFLKKQGNAFAKGGNSSNHDDVLTILQFRNHTIWDINDTQGTNISIFDNGIYDLYFKSLYVYEGVLVFNLTEIDNMNPKYDYYIITIKILFWDLVSAVFLFIAYEIYQRRKNGKKKDKL